MCSPLDLYHTFDLNADAPPQHHQQKPNKICGYSLLSVIMATSHTPSCTYVCSSVTFSICTNTLLNVLILGSSLHSCIPTKELTLLITVQLTPSKSKMVYIFKKTNMSFSQC